MFYSNSHIAPLCFPLTGCSFTRTPRGWHAAVHAGAGPLRGAPFPLPHKNPAISMAKAAEGTVVLFETVQGAAVPAPGEKPSTQGPNPTGQLAPWSQFLS